MKKFKKIILNFITCWSLLFTQAVLANGQAASDPRLFGAEPTPSVNLYDNSQWDMSAFNPHEGMIIGGGCRSFEALNFELGGIDGLIDHYRGQSCWEQVRGDLEGIQQTNGRANAVEVCQTLMRVKQENSCSQNFVMDPFGAEMGLDEQRRRPEMRELEARLKREAYKEEVDKVAKVVKSQALLASDMGLMNFLFHRIKNAPDDKKEYYKAIFGVDDNFFGANSSATLSDFASKAFQCLDIPAGVENFIREPERQCSGGGLTPGSNPSAEILTAARDGFLQDCNNSEPGSCILQGMTPEFLTGNIGDIVSGHISTQILSESEPFQSMGILDTSPIANNIANAHGMMELFNNDLGEGAHNRSTPRISTSVFEAIRAVDDPAERLTIARREALAYTMGQVTSRFEGENAQDQVAYFRGFINSIKNEEGIIDLGSYDINTVGTLLDRYAQSEESGNRSLPGDSDDTRILITNMVAGLVAGQRVGDAIAQKFHQTQSARQHLQEGGGLETLQRSARAILANTNREQARGQASELMGVLRGGLINDMPVMGAVAEMMAGESFYEGDMGRVASTLDLINLYEAIRSRHMSEATRPDSGMDQYRASYVANMEIMARLVERSAQSCQRLKSPERLRHRFCSPLSDAEYGVRALENTLESARDGNGDMHTVNMSLLFCAPMLQEDRLRRLEGAGYSRNTLTAHQEMNRICREQADLVFCGEQCNRDDQRITTLDSTLERVFGESCNDEVPNDVASAAAVNPMDGTDYDASEVAKANNAALSGAARSSANTWFDRLRNRRRESKFRGGGSGVSALPTPVASSNKVDSTYVDSERIRREAELARGASGSAMATAKLAGQGNNGQVGGNFMANALNNQAAAAPQETLSEQLRSEEDQLNPATRALLDRLEEMERRQNQLQAELQRSREEGEEEDDEDRAALLAELNRLKEQIPELESKLRKRDVREALAQAAASPAPAPVVASPVQRRSSGGFSSGGSRGPASVPTSEPAAAPVQASGSLGPQSSGGGFSGERSSFSGSSDGGGVLAPSQSGGLGASDSIISMTADIRSRAMIVAPGTSPQQAVLEARGPVLIPIGPDGEYMMYEPELTPEGEVVTRDGEIVFKAVVRVTDGEVAGRLPASIDVDGEVAGEGVLDPAVDPRRLKELDNFLDQNFQIIPTMIP